MKDNIKYTPLTEPCKSMIKDEKCLGCNRLNDPGWNGSKCEWALEQIQEPEQLRIKSFKEDKKDENSNTNSSKVKEE